MADDVAILKTKLRGVLAQLRYLPQTLRLVWAAARGWTVAWIVLLVIQGGLPVSTVYLTRLLVDRLMELMGSGGGWDALWPALLPVVAMSGVMLLTVLLRSGAGYIRSAQSELLKDYISGLIHDKSAAADLAFYEQPDCFDHLHRARAEASYRPVALLESLGSLLQDGITLVAMAAILIPYGIWLPVALLVSTLPAFYVVLRYSLRQHQWRKRTTADERRSWYYDWLLTTDETAAELRLFDLAGHFQSAYQTIRGRLRRESRQLAFSQSLAELAAGAVALAITGAVMVWMVWRAVHGQATMGDLAFFYQAYHQGHRMMHSLLQHVGQLYYNSLFLGNLFEFLALEPQVVDAPQPIMPPAVPRDGLRFQQVTFRYPGSRRVALREFDLHVPAGKIVALVGPNGAGKSTLVKLLCRFYDPEAGCITLDGIDLRKLSIVELRKRITVLFQQPVQYNATVSENIRLGDLDSSPTADEITVAAQAAGADTTIAELPDGYDQLLGKWFESGTELSVGQWQRIALARACLRQSPVIVLDEPTSAMDPWAEADWLQKFRDLADGRTAIIITHRFTTAMYADMIHVMADGQIVESGNHEQLLRQGGRYASSWERQTRGKN